jgi:hypothetical protein
VIFQTTDNSRAMTFSGAAMGAITGTIYAPAAALSVSDIAVLHGGLIVDRLTISGVAVAQVATGGAGLAAGVASVGVQGPLGLGLSLAASSPGSPGRVTATANSGPGAGFRPEGPVRRIVVGATAAPSAPAASSRSVAMGPAGMSEAPGSSVFEDSDLLTEMAVSLIAAQAAGTKDATPSPAKART